MDSKLPIYKERKGTLIITRPPARIGYRYSRHRKTFVLVNYNELYNRFKLGRISA